MSYENDWPSVKVTKAPPPCFVGVNVSVTTLYVPMEPAPACLFAFVQKWANAELLPTTRASAVAAVAVKIRTLFIPMPSVLARAELHDLMVSVTGEGGEPVWSRLWSSSETRRDATSISARAVAHECSRYPFRRADLGVCFLNRRALCKTPTGACRPTSCVC